MADRPSADKSLAVLIDADNAQLSLLPSILRRATGLGSVIVRRAYGDFTMPTLHLWRNVMLRHAIQPMQQFRNISGKSITDSALIIDAMDLLHSNRFAGFCIVSSDSDFTRLAGRICEQGLLVYGFGEEKTASAFVKACTKFIYTETLRCEPPIIPDSHANRADIATATTKSAATKAIQTPAPSSLK